MWPQEPSRLTVTARQDEEYGVADRPPRDRPQRAPGVLPPLPIPQSPGDATTLPVPPWACGPLGAKDRSRPRWKGTIQGRTREYQRTL